MLDKSANAGAHSYAERGADFYETPAVAVTALLRAEKLPKVVWEPACGRGAIGRVLQAAGHVVYATDLVDYGYGTGGLNFLAMRRAPPRCQCIVTNPPFKDAQAFVEKGLELVPRVYMLLRLAFLESERRSAILDGGMLARVLPFKSRLPMMHRDGWAGPRAGSAIAYAWFVWDTSYCGSATIRRICWRVDAAADSGAISRR